MKKVASLIKVSLVVVFTVASILVADAQNATSTLVFDDYEWNFGDIREIDGKVSHTFTFTNKGTNTIAIERVKVDCGCTEPKYSNKPIAPNGKGSIEVTFDPNRFSGDFIKRVTVYSNDGANRNLLTMTGSVISRPRTLEDDFPFELGNGLRAQVLHRGFGYVGVGTVKSMTIEIMNTNPISAVIAADNVEYDNGIFVVAAPEKLETKATGTVTLTYDLTAGKSKYGMLSDRVFLSANGIEAKMPLSANAIAVDNFDGVDISKAPQCSITPVYHNFGEAKPYTSLTTEIKITNNGKSTLIIRDVSLRHNTECSLKSGTEIRAGKSVTFTATLKTGDTYGTASGGVMIVVNDPARPYREIRLGAEVN